MEVDNAVVLSPDIGNVKRSRAYAERLNLPLAIIDKRRPAANSSEVMNVIGEVKDKNIFIFDDIVDTAGTLVNGAKAIVERGARDIYACCTHAVLSGPARKRIQNSPIKKLIVTDTIPQKNGPDFDKLEVVSISRVLADAILRLSQLAVSYPQLAECDMNPLLVFAEGEGVATLDVRFRLEND
jgi:ribose-phosphate pyrophosphokinase